jgi:hypothetical protein
MEVFSNAKEKRIKEALKAFDKTYKHVYVSSYGTLTLSEGCNYLKTELNTEFIYNLITKYQSIPEMKYCKIQHWTFERTKVKTAWVLNANNGNRQTLYLELFSYLSFPIRRLEFYYIRGHLCLLNEL